jgi:hypothetical protein
MVSFGMLRRVALVRTDVSDKFSASFIRVTRIGELGTTLALTSDRRTLRRNTKGEGSGLNGHIPSLRSLFERIRPGPNLFMTFRNNLAFYVEGLLAPFVATLRCWWPSIPSPT